MLQCVNSSAYIAFCILPDVTLDPMLNPLSVALIRGLALRQTPSDMLATLAARLVASRVVGRGVEEGFRGNLMRIVLIATLVCLMRA